MKRLLILLAALATIPSTFALPAGEFPIAGRSTGFAPYDRRNVMVAANDATALVVWEDFRVDPNLPPRVWATRVRTLTGEVLDTTGIQIAALPADEGSALRAVGTDGNDFVVAWTEGFHLKFAHITNEGVIAHRVDPNIEAEHVSISSDGSVYFVFFTFIQTRNLAPSSVNLIILDHNAAVLGRADGVVSGSDGVIDIASTITPNNQNVILAWSDAADGRVHVANYPAAPLRSGLFTPPPPPAPAFPTPPAPPTVSVATSGSEIFAAWFERPSNSYRAQRFDNSGNPLGAAFTIAPAVEDVTFNPKPAVVWDGSNYLVAFEAQDKTLQAVRYAPDGTRLDPTPISVAGGIAGVAAAPSATSNGAAVAWLTPGPAGAQVSADLLSAGGAARFGPGHLSLSTGFVDRSDAVAAWLGDHYLAAWRDQSNVTRTMVGRISPDGVPLDGDGIEVSIGSSGSPPVLASNGRNAVVAWLDSGGVSASFVDEGGHVFRRMFDFPGGQPSVNWNGQQYVVVWRSPQGQALGLRMNGAGALIDNDPVTIGPVDGDPVVGWTGNAYVLAFRGPVPIVPAPLPAPVAVLAQFVSAKLTPIGTPILVANSLRATPPLVSDTIGGSLIVWEDAPAGAQQLRGARVVNGALIDPVNGFAIGPGSNATVFPNSIGWGVIAGEDLYTVSLSGVVVPHPGEFPFVPAGTRAFVVLGGPEPLVLYRRPPQGGEQAMQVVGRYVIPEIRQRAARH